MYCIILPFYIYNTNQKRIPPKKIDKKLRKNSYDTLLGCLSMLEKMHHTKDAEMAIDGNQSNNDSDKSTCGFSIGGSSSLENWNSGCKVELGFKR